MKYLDNYQKIYEKNIFINLIDNIKEFLVWSKESKEEGFKITRKITDHLQETYFDKLYTVNSASKKLNELMDKFEKENKKEYSEEKYQLIDMIEKQFLYTRKLWDYLFENIVVSYYRKYGEEFESDLDKSISWLKTSKWYKKIDLKESTEEYLKKLKKRLSLSTIKKELDYASNFLKNN